MSYAEVKAEMAQPSEKVMVGWCDTGSNHGAFTMSMLLLQQFEQEYPDPRYRLVSPVRTAGAYVQANRNELVRRFLDTDADWLFQLDCDESFPPSLLRVLIRTADADRQPITTGIYSNVHSYAEDPSDGSVVIGNCVYMETENGSYQAVEPPESLQTFEVSGAGAGVMLVHRSVFETLVDPWYWCEWIEFTDEPGQFMGEDLAFCRRAREAGYRIICDPLAEVMHWKTLPLLPSTVRTYLHEADRVFESMKKDR